MRRKKNEGDDLWKWLFGAAAIGGVAYSVKMHSEAKAHQTAARDAALRAQHAVHQAQTAEARARKLAMEVASTAHSRIAQLHRTDVPPLQFEGCVAAATNGIHICIDMNWLLTGVVDPAKERGSIWGRVVGALAHEWYHFLDMARGTRPSHVEELNADAFAGRQLARLGVPAEHFADLVSRFPQSSTHPHGQLRARKVLEAHAAETAKMGS